MSEVTRPVSQVKERELIADLRNYIGISRTGGGDPAMRLSQLLLLLPRIEVRSLLPPSFSEFHARPPRGLSVLQRHRTPSL